MEKEIKYLVFHVDNDQQITDRCLEDIEAQLTAVSHGAGGTLYLVIQTNGGSPFAAVSILNVLQSKFEKIYAVIPKYAMSAGTLMALGTDKIYMGVRSALGPLDLPIEHPKDGSRISALDIKNAAAEIATLSDLIARKRYKILRRDEGIVLSRFEAAKIAFETATELVRPIIDKIDPFHLNKSTRELRIARDYAIDLLTSRMMRGNFEKALDTATNFVNIYPVHEYSIFAKEAKNLLGLTIGDLDSLEEWNIIKSDVNTVCTGKDYVVKFGVKTIAVSPRPPALPKSSAPIALPKSESNVELPITK